MLKETHFESPFLCMPHLYAAVFIFRC